MKPVNGAVWDELAKRWKLPAGMKTKKRRAINPRSSRRRKESLIYSDKRKWFLAAPENSYCPVALAGVIPDESGEMRPHHRRTNQVHHLRGRGKYYLDETTFLGVSEAGHAWIHANPSEAKERGWMLSKNI